MGKATECSIALDLYFDSPHWSKARLGAKKLVPHILDITWRSVPGRPQSVIPEISVTLTSDNKI